MAESLRGTAEEEFYRRNPALRPRNSRYSGEENNIGAAELNNNGPTQRSGGINTASTRPLAQQITPEEARVRNNRGERPAPTPVPGLPSPQERLPGGVVSARSARVYGNAPRPPEQTQEKPRLPESRRGLAPLLSGEFGSVRLKDWQVESDQARGEGKWRPTMARDAQDIEERSIANAAVNPGSPSRDRWPGSPPRRQRDNGADVLTGDDVWRMYLQGKAAERAQTGETAESQLRFLNQAGALSLAARNLKEIAQNPTAAPVQLGVAQRILREVANRATGEGFSTPLALGDAIAASRDARKSPPRLKEEGDPAELESRAGKSFDIAPPGPTELPFVDGKGRIISGRVYAGDTAVVRDNDPDSTATFRQTKEVPLGRLVREAADETKTPLIMAPDLRSAYKGGRYRLASDQEKSASAGKDGRTSLHGFLQQNGSEIEIYGPFGREQDYYRVGRPFNRDSEGFRELLRGTDAMPGGFQSRSAAKSPRALAQLASGTGTAFELELDDGRTVEIAPSELERYANRVAEGLASGEWGVGEGRVIQGGKLPRFYMRTESGRELLVPVQTPNDQYPVLFKAPSEGTRNYVGPAFLHPDYRVRLAAEEWAQKQGLPVSLSEIVGELGKGSFMEGETVANAHDADFRARVAVVQQGLRAGMSESEIDAALRAMNQTPAESLLARQAVISRLGLGREVDVQGLGAPRDEFQFGPSASGDDYARDLIMSSVRGVGPVADPEIYAQLSDPNFARRLQGVAGIGPVASSGLYSQLLGRAASAGGGSTMQPDLPGDAIAQQLMEEAAAQEARLRAANPTGYGYAAFGDDYRPHGDELEGGMASDRMLDEAEYRSRPIGDPVAASVMRGGGVEDQLARLAVARLANTGLATEGNIRRDLATQARLIADAANRSGQSLEEKVAAVHALTGGDVRTTRPGGDRQLTIPGWRQPAYAEEPEGWPVVPPGRQASAGAQSTPNERVLEPRSYRQMRLPVGAGAGPRQMGWNQPAAQREAAIFAELQERRRREQADGVSAQLQASNRPNQVAVNTARVSQFNAPEPANPGTGPAPAINTPAGQGTIPGMSQAASDYAVPANDRLSALTRMMAAQPRPAGAEGPARDGGGVPSWATGQSSTQPSLDFRTKSRPLSMQELVELRRRVPYAWSR